MDQIKRTRDSSIVVFDMRTNSSSAKSNEIRPWSDLPSDLIKEILSRLWVSDRIRLSLVCKSFYHSLLLNTNCHETSAIDRLPWVVNFRVERPSSGVRPDVCVFRLFDPVDHRLYAIDGIKPPDENTSIPYWNLFAFAKKGWMFCSPIQGLSSSLWLFSPFTKQIIELPDLTCGKGNTFNYTFSSDPLSSDSVYLVLVKFHESNRILVSTIREGDAEWETIEFFDELGYTPIEDVVHHEGCFYCIFGSGEIRVYDVVNKTWEAIPGLLDPALRGYLCRFYILVCAGELLVAHVYSNYYVDDPNMARCCVFGFCRSSRNWVAKTSIGDHVIFLDKSSFSISTRGIAEDIANRVYYCKPGSAGGQIYFTLQDGKGHESPGKCGLRSDDRKLWLEPPPWLPRQHSQGQVFSKVVP